MLATAMNQFSSAAVGVAHREIALVILHRRDRHFLRQLEIALVEVPSSGTGHSTSAVTSSSKRVLDDSVPPPLRELRHARANQLAPLGDVGHDMPSQQRSHTSRDSRIAAAAAHESDAARVLAGLRRREFRTRRRRAEQHHDPMHRPHELLLARAPAHALRDRQRVERSVDDPGSSAGVARPSSCRRTCSTRALRPVDLLQLIDAHAARRCESQRRLGRLTARVERIRDGGP
jgi:hypothetical protein